MTDRQHHILKMLGKVNHQTKWPESIFVIEVRFDIRSSKKSIFKLDRGSRKSSFRLEVSSRLSEIQIQSLVFIDMKHLNLFVIVGSKNHIRIKGKEREQQSSRIENPFKNNRVDLDRKCENSFNREESMKQRWSFRAKLWKWEINYRKLFKIHTKTKQ